MALMLFDDAAGNYTMLNFFFNFCTMFTQILYMFNLVKC